MLTISTARNERPQAPLFEGYGAGTKVLTIAACRNYVGEFFEELTANIIRGVRCKTDATKDICPDIQLTKKRFVEVKAVGQSGAIIVYENRLHKDLAFVKSNRVELLYCFWHHNCQIEDGITLDELRTRCASSIRSVTVINLPDLYSRLREEPVKTLSSKSTTRGYGSHGYTHGYQMRLALVRDRYFPSRYPVPIDVDVYGNRVQLTNFQIFTSRRIRSLLERVNK